MDVRKNKGITLIALIVTIIVLLILSGISISILTSTNGIIDNAFEAKKQTEYAAILEQINLAKTSLIIEKKEITAGNIKNYLTKNNIYTEDDITITAKDEETAILTIGSYDYELPLGNITFYFQKGDKWTSSHVYAYLWKTENNEIVKNANWPGIEMELVEAEQSIYKYTVSENFYGENLIFNDNNETQTVDLKLAENNYIFRVNPSNETRAVNYSTIYSGKVNIHMWKDGASGGTTWPGIPTTLLKVDIKENSTESRSFYTYNIPAEYDRFMFVEVDDNNNPINKTPDLSFEYVDVLYQGVDNTTGSSSIKVRNVYKVKYPNGSWSKYTP